MHEGSLALLAFTLISSAGLCCSKESAPGTHAPVVAWGLNSAVINSQPGISGGVRAVSARMNLSSVESN